MQKGSTLVPATGEHMRTGGDVVPRYGGGVELMDGHMIKAEDKDTFAHLEYGTSMVKEEYDTSTHFKFIPKVPQVASFEQGFTPSYKASNKVCTGRTPTILDALGTLKPPPLP